MLEKTTEKSPSVTTIRFYERISKDTKTLKATVIRHQYFEDQYNFHGGTSRKVIEDIISQMKGK